jgi:hypothetical protein
MTNRELYNYLFHFNYHTQLWYAIPRDKSREYFNEDSKQFLKSGDINTLIYKVRLLEKERKQCLEKKNIQ